MRASAKRWEGEVEGEIYVGALCVQQVSYVEKKKKEADIIIVGPVLAWA